MIAKVKRNLTWRLKVDNIVKSKSKKMDNIKVSVEGNVLILKIDTSKVIGASSTGKSELIATTRGNKQIGDGYLGLNYYRIETE